MSKAARRKLSAAVSTLMPMAMPKTRGDCVDGPRPCPFARCRHHLALDVDDRNGSIRHNFPGVAPGDWEHSCALDDADLGGMTLAEIGERMSITRERARQIEAVAMRKIRGRRYRLREHLELLDSARADR
jgi:hypothetical protein